MADAQRESMGKRLRQERERHRWTQEQLAENIGASVPSINRWEHDRAMPRQDMFMLLTEAFGRPPEQWGTAKSIPWNVPFLRNPYFTGRERILQRLHQALAASQTVALSQTRAISGLGGIGKTQTALEYAYRYANEYEAVLWLRADSSEDLISDFAALTIVLGLPTHQERDQYYVVSTVKRWLEEHGPWLLIFDNADDPTLIFDFLPRRAGGAILLTTRSQTTGPHIKKIELEKMSREEGIALLLRRVNADEEERVSAGVNQQEQEVAEQLWEAIDGLPLALDQAAAYIEETGCTLSDYLALFKTRSKQLLRLRGQLASTHPEPVATTWLLAFEKVEHSNPAAAELLRLCAFLHPDEIPEAMIIAGASALEPVLQSIATDELEWNKAIGQLRKYEQAEPLFQRALAIREKVLGPEHPYTAVSFFGLAVLYHTQGKYEQAEPLFQRTLAIDEKTLGPEAPDTASDLGGLAELYCDQGKYEQAEPLLQRALAICEKEQGTEHPWTAAVLDAQGHLALLQGREEQAAFHLQRALAIREQALGNMHPDVAETLKHLAELFEKQSKSEQAHTFYQRAVVIYEQVLGTQHLKTIQIRTHLTEAAQSE